MAEQRVGVVRLESGYNSYIEIYYVHCPHYTEIGAEEYFWCELCDKWICGEHVCSAHITWRADGTVIVDGEGYVDAP